MITPLLALGIGEFMVLFGIACIGMGGLSKIAGTLAKIEGHLALIARSLEHRDGTEEDPAPPQPDE